MNILFDIGHPAHVHMFRYFIEYLKKEGHGVTVTARKKDVLCSLLDRFGIEHIALTEPGKGYAGLLKEMIVRHRNIVSLHKKIHFDLAFGTSVNISFLTLLKGVVSVNLNEDDDAAVPLHAMLAYPFTNYICVPDCLKYKKWAKKRVKHNSYHELAYLHPDVFTPNESVLEKYGLKKDAYVIARFSALSAHHDHNAKGISGSLWPEIKKLFGDIEIVASVEGEKKNRIEPWDMHSVMAFAKMLVSDSQTMTAEAAVMGVPSVRYNSFVGRLSYLDELEHRYGLTYGFTPGDEKRILEKISELMSVSGAKAEFELKKRKMLDDKVNFSDWLINFFNNELKPPIINNVG